MYLARSILAVLFFFSSVGAVKAVFASEDSSSMAMKTKTSPAFQSSQASNVLGQIAIALAGGSEAMRALRGSPDEYGQKDRLQPMLPEMNCGIDRILSYISCYSAVINNEKEAENVFNQLVDDVKLHCHRIGGDRFKPHRCSVRSEVSVIKMGKPAPVSILSYLSDQYKISTSYHFTDGADSKRRLRFNPDG
jgi:hypothetical protein